MKVFETFDFVEQISIIILLLFEKGNMSVTILLSKKTRMVI